MTTLIKALSAFTGLADGVTRPFVGGLGDEISAAMTGFVSGRKPPGTDDITLVFSHVLSDEDNTTLDAIVAAHTGVRPGPTPQEVTIPGLIIDKGALRAAMYKPTDASDPMVSHNFGDATTWVMGSEYFSGALVRLDNHIAPGVHAWTLPDNKKRIIDTEHGKCGSLEHYLDEKYRLDVYVGGERKSVDLLHEQGDYSCDYREAIIQFHTEPAEGQAVTAECYIAASSKFCFYPPHGISWRIDEVELNQSDDAKLKDHDGLPTYVSFDTQLYAKGPDNAPVAPLPFELIPGLGAARVAKMRIYRHFDNLVDESNDYYEIDVPPNADARIEPTQKRRISKWKYKGIKPLDSMVEYMPGTYGTSVLIIRTQGDRELVGEYVKITVYVIEDEGGALK